MAVHVKAGRGRADQPQSVRVQCVRLCLMFLLVVLLSIGGAYAILEAERGADASVEAGLRSARLKCVGASMEYPTIEATLNLTDTEATSLGKAFGSTDLCVDLERYHEVESLTGKNWFRVWDFESAFLHTFSAISTIGWGYPAPLTEAAQWLSVSFACIGFPVFAYLIILLGNIFKTSIERFLTGYRESYSQHVRQKLAGEALYATRDLVEVRAPSVHSGTDDVGGAGDDGDDDDLVDKLHWKVLHDLSYMLPEVLFVAFLLYTLVMTFVFRRLLEWEFLDAFYFSVIAVTTVGLGDFVIQEKANDAFWAGTHPEDKDETGAFVIGFFVVALICLGVGIFSSFLNALVEAMMIPAVSDKDPRDSQHAKSDCKQRLLGPAVRFVQSNHLKSHLLHLALAFTYMVVTGYTVYACEKAESNSVAEDLKAVRAKCESSQAITSQAAIFNWTEAETLAIGRVGEQDICGTLARKQAVFENFGRDWYNQWNVLRAVLHSFAVSSTVGWGSPVPATTGGKAATILLAVPGIVITGTLTYRFGHGMHRAYDAFALKRTHQTALQRERVFTFLLLATLAVTASCGALITSRVFKDAWNLSESFYFFLITATTVGFGDYTPISADHDQDPPPLAVSVVVVMMVGIVIMFGIMAIETFLEELAHYEGIAVVTAAAAARNSEGIARHFHLPKSDTIASDQI